MHFELQTATSASYPSHRIVHVNRAPFSHCDYDLCDLYEFVVPSLDKRHRTTVVLYINNSPSYSILVTPLILTTLLTTRVMSKVSIDVKSHNEKQRVISPIPSPIRVRNRTLDT